MSDWSEVMHECHDRINSIMLDLKSKPYSVVLAIDYINKVTPHLIRLQDCCYIDSHTERTSMPDLVFFTVYEIIAGWISISEKMCSLYQCDQLLLSTLINDFSNNKTKLHQLFVLLESLNMDNKIKGSLAHVEQNINIQANDVMNKLAIAWQPWRPKH